MISKDMGGYLKIYDTGQQEAWLRWLLLKEFGHPLANTLLKIRRMDTCNIEQHRVWMHNVGVTLISLIVSSSQELYDGSMRR